MAFISIDPGNTLGFYHTIADELMLISVCVLLLGAFFYNIFVAIASKWMYTHAVWRSDGIGRKEDIPLNDMADTSEPIPSIKNDELPDHLHTSIWEEVFILNIKISGFLLGNFVKIKDLKHYVVVKMHDIVIFMPLAMIFTQCSEIAVAIVTLAIFVEYTFIEVYVLPFN